MSAYNKINWEDSPSTSTPLTAENLNHMDDGIEAATQAITELEASIAKKADKTQVDTALTAKADKSEVYNKSETESKLAAKLNDTNGSVHYANLAGDVFASKIEGGQLGAARATAVYTELTKKADKTELTAGLKEKQNVQYLNNTVTTLEDFTAHNQTNTVYTGRMQGFSTKFGESSDDAVKGFRMWFVLSGSDNPTWYRVILFDDGTIWTATRSGTTFTQRSYTKIQIDKMLAEKAGLDAYENVKVISTQVTSAGVLNQFFSDKNKKYVFTAIPPLSNELDVTPTSQFELHNYEDYQILRATGRPNKSDGNKTFIRLYNEDDNTWNDVVDCTLPDSYITKAKLSADLSAEISGKYDASNIETGSGEFTTTSSRISSANFEYQKIGDYVTVNIFASFAESSMGATTSIQLSGMPFVNESSGTLRLPCATSKKTSLIAALGKNTINILTSEAVTFSADETMGITITYKITKNNGG